MKVAGSPATKEVDWRYWLEGSKELERTHATTGRENTQLNMHSIPPASAPCVNPASIKAELIAALRRNGLAYKTEQSYGDWVSRFLTFCSRQSLSARTAQDVRAFLDYLVLNRNVASSTQNQALNALVFLFRHVYGTELGELGDFVYSKRPRRLPVVLTRQEVSTLLQCLNGRNGLMASLLYGTGMRLMECLRLRVQDVDFGYRQILVRNAKGGKDRVTPLPERLIEALQSQLDETKQIHDADLRLGFGEVWMPAALSRKWPNAARSWGW